ncbi:MAG: DNA helicase RecQ [Acidobacteriota bacterium]|nr:DNA helicase RecQ [Acidobacteriota bacterium]
MNVRNAGHAGRPAGEVAPPTEDPLRALLGSHFGHDAFRPLQERAIRLALAGRDTVVLMPTGGGKSLCYQLPALARDGLTLVVSPLIALMKDQVDALRARGIAAGCLNSSMRADEAAEVRRAALRGDLKLLYAAPERVALPGFPDFLRRLRVGFVAVDEAHCISQWGHEFRPDYLTLGALREEVPEVPFMALTATATPRVRADVAKRLGMAHPEFLVASFNRPNIRYGVRPKRRSLPVLTSMLRERAGESAIVYCLARRETENVAAALRDAGIEALPYHAGLEHEVRRDTHERFTSKRTPVIVATIAFGMGIDVPDIRLIVHYNLPKSLEGYYQETGRAGRDGKPSDCVLFYTTADRSTQEKFIREIEDPVEQERALARLRRVLGYCQLRTCRPRHLLDYFGEASPEGQDNCGNCDNCLDPEADAAEFDGTEIARKILSAVHRTGARFGMAHVTEVLRGSRSRKVLQFRHDRLSVHGIARDVPAEELRDLADQLVDRGLLLRAAGEFPTVSIAPAGWRFLRAGERITLTRPRSAAPGPRKAGAPDSTAAALAASSDPAAPAPPEIEADLFEALREVRRRLAERDRLRPFHVCGDRTLREIAAYLPQSEESLLRVHGLGPAKLERYGASLLEAVRAHAGAKELPDRTSGLGPPTKARSSGPAKRSATLDTTRELLEEGRSVAEIAETRAASVNTVLNHLERLVRNGTALDLSASLPDPARAARIREALATAGSEALRPVRDQLGPAYSYEEIRIVRASVRARTPAAPQRAVTDSSSSSDAG